MQKVKLLVDNGDIKSLKPNLKDCESVGNKTPRVYRGGRISAPEVAMKKEKIDRCFLFQQGRWSLFEGGF